MFSDVCCAGLVQLVELQIFICNSSSVLLCSAGALLMTTDSAAAADDDKVVAVKAAASEAVTRMTVSPLAANLSCRR